MNTVAGNPGRSEGAEAFRSYPTLIRRLATGIPTREILAALDAHPELWNQFRPRTDQYAHSAVSDIWVRYNAWENYDPEKGLEDFNREHEAVWYPAARAIPALKNMALDVMRMVDGVRLGGVLITRVPSGGRVQPHIDRGWHATYYDKFAVQLLAGEEQGFYFAQDGLVSQTGDLFTFNNSKMHWVENRGSQDRITMIICVRLDRPHAYLWVKKPE